MPPCPSPCSACIGPGLVGRTVGHRAMMPRWSPESTGKQKLIPLSRVHLGFLDFAEAACGPIGGIGRVHQVLGKVLVVPLLAARLAFLGPPVAIAIPLVQRLHTVCKYFHWLQHAVNERLVFQKLLQVLLATVDVLHHAQKTAVLPLTALVWAEAQVKLINT